MRVFLVAFYFYVYFYYLFLFSMLHLIFNFIFNLREHRPQVSASTARNVPRAPPAIFLGHWRMRCSSLNFCSTLRSNVCAWQLRHMMATTPFISSSTQVA